MLNTVKKIVKQLLAIVWIRRLYEGFMRVTLEILAINRLTSLVYSVLSIPTFNREQFAVLRGRRDYFRNLSRQRGQFALAPTVTPPGSTWTGVCRRVSRRTGCNPAATAGT